MDLHEILEALDIAAKGKDGTAIIPRRLAEDARDALQMLAAGMEKRAGAAPQAQAPPPAGWKTVGEPGEVRYSAEDYVAALLALDTMRKGEKDPENRAAMCLLLEAVAEKAGREYPDRFRRLD